MKPPAHLRARIWWHERRHPEHDAYLRKVSLPAWDMTVRGFLFRCHDCRKGWTA